MFQRKNYLLVLLLPLLSPYLKAQDSTRVIKPATKFITEREINLGLSYTLLDTAMFRNEIFHPGYKNHIVFQDLGNMGTASRPLLFNPEREAGFQYGFNPFDMYFINPLQTRFYNTKSPYTDLFYAQGSNELIFLQAKHSQNILPRWNVGLEYQRITSQGFYLKQLTSLYNYQFYTHYTSKNKRYELLAHATWNRGVNEESGGVQSDSSFESLTGANKRVLVRLSNSQTRFKSRDGYLKQYYKFGNGGFTPYGEDSIYHFTPQFQVSHTIHAKEISYVFENFGDVDSLLLPNRYYDTTTNTIDSSYYGSLSNSFQLHYFGRLNADSTRLVFSSGMRYDLINAGQIAFARLYNNITIEGGVEKVSLKTNQSLLGLSASYTVYGYNSGDYKLSGFYTIPLGWFALTPQITLQQYRPDFTMQLFKTNQFIWNNTFNPIQYIKGGINIKTRTLKHPLEFRFNYYQLTNLVYVNEKALPQQYTGNTQVITAELSKTFQLWKFRFEHQVIYQQSSNDYIRVPQLSGMVRYYFQSRIFGSSIFQLGFDAFYNTAYKGNAYNPASRLFYLQNNVSIGNYPVIDPFICLEIKRAIIFAKFEHVNQDWTNTGFYYTPHYPVSLSSFRMGVRWRMYN